MKESTPNQDPPRLLRSRPETLKMMGGIGLTTLDALLNEGKLTKVKIGRRALVTDESIRRYIAEQQVTCL